MKRTMVAAAATFLSLSSPVSMGGPVAWASIALAPDEVGCCNDVCCWIDDSELCLNPPPGCEDGPAYPYPSE